MIHARLSLNISVSLFFTAFTCLRKYRLLRKITSKATAAITKQVIYVGDKMKVLSEKSDIIANSKANAHGKNKMPPNIKAGNISHFKLPAVISIFIRPLFSEIFPLKATRQPNLFNDFI